MDVMMPVMGGFEACSYLHKNQATCDILVVLLTGCKDTDDIVNGFNSGAVDYLAKPINLTELLVRV